MGQRRPETEQIDRLFLELSQFTRASTRKELMLETTLCGLLRAIQQGLVLTVDDAIVKDARKTLEHYQAWQGKGGAPNPRRI